MEIIPTSNICRYYNASGGCWFGNSCRFLHIPEKKPICKFFFYEGGCRFGDECHFRHSMTNTNEKLDTQDEKTSAINADRNNNNMPSGNIHKTLADTEEIDNTEHDEDIKNICCSACKWSDRCKNDQTKKLLRGHYMAKFLKKDGQHVKSIKRLTFLPTDHVYWCKICLMSFEKSWSLFQHLADKSRPNKDDKQNANAHKETLENIAGSLTGFDLGLINLQKLQTDVSSIITNLMSNMFDTFLTQSRVSASSRLKNLRSAIKISNKNVATDFMRMWQDLMILDEENDEGSGEWVYLGMTQEDVDELLRQGIKPWEPEAYAALAILKGEGVDSD